MEVGHNAKEQLRSIVERVERLEEEKAQIAGDIKEIYAEAKGNGFCVSSLRAIVRMRRMDKEKREALEATLEAYKASLGMLVGTPLGDYVLEHTEAAQ